MTRNCSLAVQLPMESKNCPKWPGREDVRTRRDHDLLQHVLLSQIINTTVYEQANYFFSQTCLLLFAKLHNSWHSFIPFPSIFTFHKMLGLIQPH